MFGNLRTTTGKETREVMVTVDIADKYGHPYTGFIELTVGGGDGVMFDESNLKTHRAALTSHGVANEKAGRLVVTVVGIPEDNPVRIPVTAKLGSLTLTKNIEGTGNAIGVTASAYVCDQDDDPAEMKPEDPPAEPILMIADEAKICALEVRALNNKPVGDDPDEVIALAPGDTFFISAKAVDGAGNTIANSVGTTPTEIPWELTAGADNEDDAEKSFLSVSGVTNSPITVADEKTAVAGTYSITVESPDGDASEMVQVTVSAKASMLSVTCDPEIVPIRTGETLCTATVTDAGGNIPSNLISKGEDRNKVSIAVRNKDAQYSDSANFDAMGKANFSVLLAEDVEVGREITVNVITTIGDDTLRQSTVITYGMAQPEMMAPGMPMNVMAEATSHDMITVSWESPAADGGSDITGYMVQSAYMMADGMMSDWMDVDPAHMGMDMMYMDMGLMAETTYYYRVAAMNSAGKGDFSTLSYGMAMAMTMMMPPGEGEMMTLATLANVLGSYLAAVNTFGVTWTPAADAQQQYVVLASLADGYSVVTVKVLGADASSHEFTVEDAAGDYEIFVATYFDGKFYYDDSTATMVTVE